MANKKSSPQQPEQTTASAIKPAPWWRAATNAVLAVVVNTMTAPLRISRRYASSRLTVYGGYLFTEQDLQDAARARLYRNGIDEYLKNVQDSSLTMADIVKNNTLPDYVSNLAGLYREFMAHQRSPAAQRAVPKQRAPVNPSEAPTVSATEAPTVVMESKPPKGKVPFPPSRGHAGVQNG